MHEELHIDPHALVEEIARYLAAVDAFRAAGCEPSWRLELPLVTADAIVVEASSAGVERSAH